MPSLALWNAVVTDPSGFHGLSAGGLGEPREKLRMSPWEHREARKLMEIQHETFVEWWADWVSWVINLTDDIYIWCIGDFTSEIYWSSLGLILHLVLDCSARQLRDLQTARPKVEPHVYKDIDMHRPFVLMPCGSTTIQSVVVNMSSFLVCCFQGIPMIFL